MPDETAKEKGRIWEQKRTCQYCGKEHAGEDLGFVHRNAKGNPDWSICFRCVKRFFDKTHGKKTEFKEEVEKCTYCGRQEKPYFTHYDKEDRLIWFVCYNCLKKAFDNALKKERAI